MIEATGIDLSYVSTGIAWADRCVDTFGTDPAQSDIARAHRIALDVCARTCDADIAVIEDGVHRSTYAFRAGILHGVVRRLLEDTRPHMPVALMPVKALKKFATGNGNAGKPEMIVAARERLGYDGFQDDEADALWLRQVGLHVLKAPNAVKLPQTQIDALAKVVMP